MTRPSIPIGSYRVLSWRALKRVHEHPEQIIDSLRACAARNRMAAVGSGATAKLERRTSIVMKSGGRLRQFSGK
jgi:hypothetical protein